MQLWALRCLVSGPTELLCAEVAVQIVSLIWFERLDVCVVAVGSFVAIYNFILLIFSETVLSGVIFIPT